MFTRKSLALCAVLLALITLPITTATAQYPLTEGNDNGTYAWEMRTGAEFDWDFGPGNTGATQHSIPNNMSIGPIPIGFNFYFHGTTYTEFWLSSHGFLSFLPLQTIGNAGPLNGEIFPTSSLSGPVIAPCFVGLAPGTGGSVTSRYFGASPNRTYVLEFNEVPYMAQQGTANFQVALFEHDNSFDLRHLATALPTQFGSGTSGYSMSIGFQSGALNGLTMVGPTSAGTLIQPPLINTSWLGYHCAFPGSEEGLFLTYKTIDLAGASSPTTHCNGPRLRSGETMTTELVSKGGFHEFQEMILAFQVFFIAGIRPWSPVGFPTVHLHPFFSQTTGYAHIGMAITGVRVVNNFPIPVGIVGMGARFQAYVFGTGNANGFFASSHALDLSIIP